MKKPIALFIKLIVTYTVAWISFTLIDNVLITDVLIIVGLGTIFNYFIGDLFILRRFGNTIASVTNGIITGVTAYIILIIVNDGGTSSILTYSLMVMVIEFLFHTFLYQANSIKKNTTYNVMPNSRKLNYSSEIAKEMNPDRNILRSIKKKKDN